MTHLFCKSVTHVERQLHAFELEVNVERIEETTDFGLVFVCR